MFTVYGPFTSGHFDNTQRQATYTNLPTRPLERQAQTRPAVKMGRKKIIIKRLTEDRNRNVTFLKASIRCAHHRAGAKTVVLTKSQTTTLSA